MAKVTGFTAQRMLEIEQASVVDAAIEGADELIFYTRGGKRIRAGVIKGGTAEWIEEYKPIVDDSVEKVGDLLQSYNDMSELFVEVDQNLANLDQDLEDMHTRVDTVSKDAMDALQNANAAAQTVTVEYAISQSHTVPPLSGWANEQPAPQPGDVVWSRIVTTYGSGYTARSEPSPMTGWAGIDGVPGKDGFGVVETVVSYVTSLSGTVTPSTGWTTTVPALVQGRFLWTRTVWHYSDSSTETGYSVSYIAQDGSTGDDGLPGKDGVGIINTTITYASSDSGVNAPSSGWVAQPPAAIAGQFVWTRTVWEYSDNTTETGYSVGKIGNTGAKGDSGADGLPGKDGTTLVSTLIQYALTTSGTNIPSTGWDTAIPTLTKGRYLWTKTTWTYSDKTPEVAHTVSYIAQDGSTGDDGLPGKDGVGHTGTTIEYAQSTSGTTAPTSGWAAQPPAPIAGRYIWTRTTWLYSDNTSEVGYSVGKIGDTGAKGNKGDTGTDGLPGKDGFGVKTTAINYAKSTSGTTTPSSGWTTSVPASTPGQFLWTRTVWTYTDNSTETAYSVSMWGSKGDTGNDGIAGKDGVGIKTTVINYVKSTSGTVAPTTGWGTTVPAATAGQYLWTRTVWTYTDNTTETGYSVAMWGMAGAKGDTGAKGDKGDTGTDGLPGKDGFGVKTTAINYAKSTSGTTTPSSGWTTSVPASTPGQFLWTRTVWTYTDNSTETAYSVSMWGSKGDTGNDGIAGKDGVGIKTTVINYVKSTSGTVAPTTGWGTTVPAATAGQYLWTRTVWTYTDNTTETGYSVAMWGMAGAKGDTGAKGNTGTGISSITPQYKSLPNLWGTPNPSENIAGYGGSNSTHTQTPLGLLVEVTKVQSYDYSLVFTQSSYRVPVAANKNYTWRLPFKNVGTVPFPLTVYSWIAGGSTKTSRQTLAPGESITVAFDDMTTPQTEAATIRYSIYYSDSETKPPIGAKILIADGATLVEGLTDDPWSNTEPPLQIGYSLFRREKIELDNGTVMYTPTSLVTANQSAERSLYISNLAKELAEGLVDLSPSMPENPLPGQVWISQDEKTNMTGVWRFNGSEWQQSSILTGLIMVPGEDGQMTLIGPKGVDAPSVLADIIRTEVLYADVGGVKKFIVSDIPRENLEDGVKTALDTAESIGTRIVLDGSEGKLIIARDKYRSGVSDTMTVLTASSMNFMFDGQAVTSINSATRQLTTVNAQVQGALRFPSHTIKTLPGTSILVFQQA